MKPLLNRYQNKRQMASNHVNAMLNFPAIHSESATSIKALHDLLTESLHAIKNLGIPTLSWNYITIPIIIIKLDNERFKLFEMLIANPRTFQIYRARAALQHVFKGEPPSLAIFYKMFSLYGTSQHFIALQKVRQVDS